MPAIILCCYCQRRLKPGIALDGYRMVSWPTEAGTRWSRMCVKCATPALMESEKKAGRTVYELFVKGNGLRNSMMGR